MEQKSSVKVWIVAAVVVLATLFIWWLSSGQSGNVKVPDNASAIPPQDQSQPSSVGPGSASSPSDTSDSALDGDLSSIDAQLKGLNADASSVDQGLNDQPIEQGQ